MNSTSTSTSTSQINMIDATHPMCETGDLPSRYAPLADIGCVASIIFIWLVLVLAK